MRYFFVLVSLQFGPGLEQSQVPCLIYPFEHTSSGWSGAALGPVQMAHLIKTTEFFQHFRVWFSLDSRVQESYGALVIFALLKT